MTCLRGGTAICLTVGRPVAGLDQGVQIGPADKDERPILTVASLRSESARRIQRSDLCKYRAASLWSRSGPPGGVNVVMRPHQIEIEIVHIGRRSDVYR